MKTLKLTCLLLILSLLLVSFISCGETGNKDDDPTGTDPVDNTPTTLSIPVVTIDEDGKATWSKQEGTVSFVIVVDGGDEVSTTENSFTLENGQSIKVKAIGDGTQFLDSAFSTEKTYTEPDHFSNYY